MLKELIIPFVTLAANVKVIEPFSTAPANWGNFEITWKRPGATVSIPGNLTFTNLPLEEVRH
jgi:hypothetical protein